MGLMTRAELLVQGGLAAASDEPSVYVRNWLDNWLFRVAKSWSWPGLKYEMGDIEVAAGEAMVQVGQPDPDDDDPLYIHKLLHGKLLWRSGDYRANGEILVKRLAAGGADSNPYTTQASQRLGTPMECIIRQGDGGAHADRCLRIYLHPVPNITVYLTGTFHVLPRPIGPLEDNDDERPWYPNDRTLEQAVKCAFMEQDDGAESKKNLQDELQRLEAMVITDRDTDGAQAGDNEVMELDASTFR